MNEVFKQLTGLGRAGKMKHLWQSPFTLHKRIVTAIRNEAAQAAAGKQARIVAKMNALLAADHRGALCRVRRRREDRAHGARRVRSSRHRRAIGEHPRALGGRTLPRAHAHLLLPQRRRRGRVPRERRLDGPHFFRRIELCFPVLDAALKRRVIREGLQPYLDDNCQAWVRTPTADESAQAAARPAPLGPGGAAVHARTRGVRFRPVAGEQTQRKEASQGNSLRRVLNAVHIRFPALPRRPGTKTRFARS